ncbi:MAG TPA: peptidoglycan-binding domain-containing protein [Bryobacteraceae bacterium]|nr:peptidoglycan-binding domain-containing protein [Bryobacteraceae bacterium]
MLGVLLMWALPGFAASKKAHHPAARKHSTASHQASTARPSAARAATSGKGRTSAKGRTSGKGKTLAKGKKASARDRALARLRRQTWRTGQMAPTPDRYREIQQALVAKGYGSQEPDGVWGPQWIESLKRFQQAQNLEPSGKLNALSLIGLGLGPRRETILPSASASTGTASTQPITREQQ